MKRIIVALAVISCTAIVNAQTREESEKIRTEIESNLVGNILPFWLDNAADPDGGFHGAIGVDGKAIEGAERGTLMTARILWTFARAYRQYGLEEYRNMADYAAENLINDCIDKKYGGMFWTIDGDGAVMDGTKMTYATAFGIYSLSEHFRATGNRKSLETAIALYRTLEENAHDKVKMGYIEAFNRDYTIGDMKGVDGRNASKTMNTHIHILEAYTCLYLAWPDEGLKANLVELLDILGNKLYSPETKHLILFCTDDWQPMGRIDSYGHDIEAAWLMCEAADAIADEDIIAKVYAQAIEMTDTALAEGLNEDGIMLYEKSEEGYSKKLSWWPQCEAIVGCINAWQLTGDRKYFDTAVKIWDFTKTHFVDNENGGWFKRIRKDGTPVHEPKGNTWNCPYHNSRLGFELIHRLAHPAVHTEVMAWSNITGVRLEGELIDFESTLRVGVPGGEIESTGREKQNRIRYNRDSATQTTITPMHGAVITQTVTDVDMSTVNLTWSVEAVETLDEGVYFCMTLTPKYYSDATIKTSGRNITIKAPERNISLRFNKSVKAFVREEDGNKVIYITLMPSLKKNAKAEWAAVMKVDGVRHHETAEISIDPLKPGREFAGFGGNFRIQNVQKDPMVIDYCLKNMRLAYGRVEMPWAQWDEHGKDADHIKRSAEMARKLKEIGMPVIVSCWFPPKWAGNQTTRSDGTSRAFALKPEEKTRIYESLASYLEFLKVDYGVEADFFSFNESDLGIDVVFTPEEHRDFIKEFGQYLADRNLKTLMLLGDNSDATTFDFILPALNDPLAHRYIGAVSFHSWRGCDDKTLEKWAAASRQINVPLIVGEGSTDAAAHQYPGIFNETTFALYEINLYVRICNISQPLSILQWQLTSDYSILWGAGIYGSEGPLRPTQRYFNLLQLSMTPQNAFAIPSVCDKDNINVASYAKPSTGECAVHIVNNAASCEAVISGFPAATTEATVYITNTHTNAEAALLPVKEGRVTVNMPAESFITILTK